MTFRQVATAAAIIMASATGAVAQPYPAKPVKIVVAFAPGGATDVIARKFAQKFSEQMKQPFIVENRAGASGTIGTRVVAESAADGYTLLAVENTFANYPHVFKSLPFDHAKALAPITVTMLLPVVAVTKADGRFRTLGELITHARANPDTVTFGTGGAGSAPHFATEAFQHMAGVKLSHIPYKGAGEAMIGLISGQIDVLFISTASAQAQIKSGRAKALAISGETRTASLPDVPTFKEAGLPSFGVFNWNGLAAPAGTSPAIIETLHKAVRDALADKDIQDFVESLNAQPGGMPPSDFAKLIADETARGTALAARAGIEKQ
jgi:tripartite-type tricarboxylate transporter receptor subunit TctC